MVVNTIPPVEVKNISLQKNTHNTIVADVPQGYIRTRLVNGTRNAIIQTRVMQAGKEVTLNVQAINSTDKYLVGKYDLEILTLPRIYKTIEVTQGGFTNIDILASGTFSYKVSRLITGQIFIKNNEGSWDWVCNIDPMSYSGTWELQPNTYKIVYRQKDLKSTNYTTEKEFTIFSNKTTTLNL
jgi:Ca-activated chloride channel family protein